MKIKAFGWICCVLSGVFAPCSLRAQENTAEWKLFETELLEKNSQIQTISCKFEQTRQTSVLKEAVRKTGDFYYKRPDNIRLGFSDGDDITMNGEYFRITSSGKTSVVKMQSNPMLKELKRILSSCMSADISGLTAGFVPKLAVKEDQYELELTPKRRTNLKSLLLVFSRKDMSLDMLKMTEHSEDYTLYRFSGKRFDLPLQDGIFKIERP